MPAAPGRTFGSDAHSFPQAPQFLGSASRLTQLPAHAFGVGDWHEAVHWDPADIFMQKGIVAGQLTPQPP